MQPVSLALALQPQSHEISSTALRHRRESQPIDAALQDVADSSEKPVRKTDKPVGKQEVDVVEGIAVRPA
jgi:hypothetical protein